MLYGHLDFILLQTKMVLILRYINRFLYTIRIATDEENIYMFCACFSLINNDAALSRNRMVTASELTSVEALKNEDPKS